MTRGESATIVEKKGTWPEIGAALQRERSVQTVEGMGILLCVVMVIERDSDVAREATNKEFLVDDHVT